MQGGEGLVRAAETMLRNAGQCVFLRLPLPAVAGDQAEVLGLAEPQFQDVPLTPCAFRKTSGTEMLLISAKAVEKIVGSLAYDSAQVLFSAAAGVVVDGVLFLVKQFDVEHACGEVLCYRVALARPVSG